MIRDNKGLSLIEVVMVIVVLGIAIPPLLTMWANVAWRSTRSESLADALFYAQELMEEIKTKRFDEKTVSPWSVTLGPDTSTKGLDGISDETASAKNNWDDVDDFNGYADSPATGYNRSAAVGYVTLSATTWQNSASSTDYKRITVLVKDVSLVTIASVY